MDVTHVRLKSPEKEKKGQFGQLQHVYKELNIFKKIKTRVPLCHSGPEGVD